MAGDRRLIEWIDLVGDLLQRPLADFPVAQIAMQLNRTFQVRAVSWDWREDDARSGFQTWPKIDLGAIAHLPPWNDETQTILDQHPLIRWFVTTRDPTPQSTGRVPDSLAMRTDGQLVDDYLKPLGFDQQLSIPYAFDGFRYGAFVLGRPDNDFLDDDLEARWPSTAPHSGPVPPDGTRGSKPSAGERDLRSGRKDSPYGHGVRSSDSLGRGAHCLRNRAPTRDGTADRQQAPRAHLSQVRGGRPSRRRPRRPRGWHSRQRPGRTIAVCRAGVRCREPLRPRRRRTPRYDARARARGSPADPDALALVCHRHHVARDHAVAVPGPPCRARRARGWTDDDRLPAG